MTDEKKSYPNMKGMRRHSNACIVTGTNLLNPEHVSPAGLCSVCLKCGTCEIGKKAKTGRTLFPEPFGTAQFSPEKRLPFIDDIQILPQIIGDEVIFRKVDTTSNIGGFKCSAPLSIAGMGSTIVAHKHGTDLAIGAAQAGIPMVVGENVFVTYGEKGLKERMKPYLDNYHRRGALVVQANGNEFKLDIPKIAVSLGAHAIELKLGQGCKMGLGGEIQFKSTKEAEKYKKYGYTIIKTKDGYQRHSSPGSINEQLARDMLLKCKDLHVPIWIKIAAGKDIIKTLEFLQKIKKKEKIPLKCVTIDGYGGSTGMSPWLVMNEIGVPSLSVMQRINKRKIDYDIMLTGGFANGMDIGKALMLGADSVAMGRAFLIAANINKAKGIVNFVEAIKEELGMLCATQRVNKVQLLKGRKNNLLALTKEAGKMFGIEHEVKKLL